jgi:hypothetical protein
MRIRVESAEVHTLHVDGRHWDNFGSAPIPKEELPAFFALSLSQQLERLASLGDVPNPPDVSVRFWIGEKMLMETHAHESFDPEWREGEEPIVELAPGTQVRVDVEDLDLAFHDQIGEITVTVPEQPANGYWILGPFGQVRKLVLRCD